MSRNAKRLPCLLLALVCSSDAAFADDAVARLTPERLEAVTQAVAKFRAERRELQRPGVYRDFRANLHVHSAFSHDSRGQIDDIVAAAKQVGTQVLMFTEHPAEHQDFFVDGHRGVRDGVLLIPGAEMRGFLVFPTHSLKGLEGGSNQEFADLVCGRDGRLFVSHLEERMDWGIQGITGVEIYNTHADFKDEAGLIAALRNPLWLFRSADLFRKYPQAAFSALQDHPADYLRRYDELCQRAPHTGVSANDAHQNVGLRLRLVDGNKVRLEDALHKTLLESDAGSNPAFEKLTVGKQAGDVVFESLMDRYEVSLQHVGTHLLMRELTRESVWESLAAGRAFVSFDWLCDARGFDFVAVRDSERFEMGSQVPLADGLRFRAQLPLSARCKLVRNGQVFVEAQGETFEAIVTESGVYRIEVWLECAGELKTWILSNPIYVTAPAKTLP